MVYARIVKVRFCIYVYGCFKHITNNNKTPTSAMNPCLDLKSTLDSYVKDLRNLNYVLKKKIYIYICKPNVT